MSVRGDLESTSLLEELLDLLAVLAVLDNSLEIGVTANVLLADEDVGNGALAGQLEKGILDIGAVALLVELVGGVLGIETVEDLLGVGAIGAVRLAEDNYWRRKDSLATVSFMRRAAKWLPSRQTGVKLISKFLSATRARPKTGTASLCKRHTIKGPRANGHMHQAAGLAHTHGAHV